MEKWDLLLLCVVCLGVLVSFYDTSQLSLEKSWHLPIDSNSYFNTHFPQESERLPLPLITDLDGDGLQEVILVTPDYKLMSIDASKNIISVKAEASLLPTVRVSTGRKPIALSSGYVTEPKVGETRHQVIVVITNGWTVLCFNHKLKLLWESNVLDFASVDSFHREVAATITWKPLRIGDKGGVIVGGRLTSIDQQMEHSHESDEGDQKEELADDEFTRHFSFYAFDGRTGALVWKHEYGDFFSEDKHDDEEDEVVYKSLHVDAIFQLMPEHSYKLHVFGKSRNKPNVIVAHLKDGIEVIHLYTGGTLTRIPLPPDGLFADINGDDIVDHIYAAKRDDDLVGFATSGVPLGSELLFNVSLITGQGTGFGRLLSGIGDPSLKKKKAQAINPILLSYDEELHSVFLVSNGVMTSFSSNGKVDWQLETQVEWDPSQQIFASLEVITIKEVQYILAVAQEIAIISSSGHLLVYDSVNSVPVSPPAIGDFNNDGQNDIIVATVKGYYGFSVSAHIGYNFFQIALTAILCCLMLLLIFTFATLSKESSKSK